MSFKRVLREIKAIKTFYTTESNNKSPSCKMAIATCLKLVVSLLTFGTSDLQVKPSLPLEKDLPLKVFN